MPFTFNRCWNYEILTGWDLLCRIHKSLGSERDSIQNLWVVWSFGHLVVFLFYRNALIQAVCSTWRHIHINDPYYLGPQKKYLWSSVLYFEFLRFCIFASGPVLGPTASYRTSTKYKSVGIKIQNLWPCIFSLDLNTRDHIYRTVVQAAKRQIPVKRWRRAVQKTWALTGGRDER
jgi:hypothetical protein